MRPIADPGAPERHQDRLLVESLVTVGDVVFDAWSGIGDMGASVVKRRGIVHAHARTDEEFMGLIGLAGDRFERVHCGNLTTMELPSGVTVVVLSDVLDHLASEDVDLVLRRLWAAADPLACIMASFDIGEPDCTQFDPVIHWLNHLHEAGWVRPLMLNGWDEVEGWMQVVVERCGCSSHHGASP